MGVDFEPHSKRVDNQVEKYVRKHPELAGWMIGYITQWVKRYSAWWNKEKLGLSASDLGELNNMFPDPDTDPKYKQLQDSLPGMQRGGLSRRVWALAEKIYREPEGRLDKKRKLTEGKPVLEESSEEISPQAPVAIDWTNYPHVVRGRIPDPFGFTLSDTGADPRVVLDGTVDPDDLNDFGGSC